VRSSVADARIDDCVRDIHRKIDQDVHGRREQNRALNQRKITIENRIDGQPSNAGPRKDCFGDNAGGARYWTTGIWSYGGGERYGRK